MTLNKFLSIFLMTVFATCSSMVFAKNKTQQIEALVDQYAQHQVFSGAVLVANQGKIIYQAGHGLANREWNLKNSTDVKFGLGSISKSVTATLIMMMVESNELALSNTLEQYLPEFPKQIASKVTIHHLLSHTSGIPNYFRIDGWFTGDFRREVTDEEFVKVIANLGIDFEPGTRYMYSNSGYYLLTKVVESVAKKPFAEVLQERIFKPLKMASTGPHIASTLLEKRASGYRWAQNGGLKNQPYINTSLFRGAGDLYSTVGDLLNWEQSLYSDRLLSKDSKSIMIAPENSYGWNINQIQLDEKTQKNAVWYEGQLLGFSSILTRLVDDNFTVIILSNNGMSSQERYAMTNEIIQILYGVKPSTTKQPVTHLLTSALASGNLTDAIAEYKAESARHTIDEERINGLATQLLWSGAIKLATQVLEFNTELFPNSARAFAQLGEALQRAGNVTKAKQHFTRAAELDPNNTYYQKKLADLKPE